MFCLIRHIHVHIAVDVLLLKEKNNTCMIIYLKTKLSNAAEKRNKTVIFKMLNLLAVYKYKLYLSKLSNASMKIP